MLKKSGQMIVEPNDLKIGTSRRLNRKIDEKCCYSFITVGEYLKASEVSSYICGFFGLGSISDRFRVPIQ